MTLLSPLFVLLFAPPHLLYQHSLAEIIGLRLPGMLYSILLPLLLTMVLFLGPLVMLILDARTRVYMVPDYWRQCITNWIWWRNHVVAPFSEEFTFRACMVPVLLGYYTHSQVGYCDMTIDQGRNSILCIYKIKMSHYWEPEGEAREKGRGFSVHA